jgi:hypothetical protein
MRPGKEPDGWSANEAHAECQSVIGQNLIPRLEVLG